MVSNKVRKSKNSNSLLISSAIILCAAIVFIFAVQRNKTATAPDNPSAAAMKSVPDAAEDDTTAEKKDDGNVHVIAQGDSLIIPISDISSTVAFYPIEVDGTRMEVLAAADSEGNIRTAFNTCQICYGSGRGHYVQEGNTLVCQNCGNRFTVDQVEIQSGGCNPWPIFPENKTVTDNTIEISYDFLNESSLPSYIIQSFPYTCPQFRIVTVHFL